MDIILVLHIETKLRIGLIIIVLEEQKFMAPIIAATNFNVMSLKNGLNGLCRMIVLLINQCEL